MVVVVVSSRGSDRPGLSNKGACGQGWGTKIGRRGNCIWLYHLAIIVLLYLQPRRTAVLLQIWALIPHTGSANGDSKRCIAGLGELVLLDGNWKSRKAAHARQKILSIFAGFSPYSRA